MLRKTKEDVHSLSKSRIDASLPNIASFLNALDIHEGDPKYLQGDQHSSYGKPDLHNNTSGSI